VDRVDTERRQIDFGLVKEHGDRETRGDKKRDGETRKTIGKREEKTER
jgi:hypothetical protein